MGAGIAGAVIGGMFTMSGAGKMASAAKTEGVEARRRGFRQKAFSEIAAQEMRAIGQMAAFEEGRQAQLMASRAVAVAAAGGAVSDITNLIADIYGEGAYRASIALRDYEAQARKLEFEGMEAGLYGEELEKAGHKRAKAIRMEAFGQVITSAAASYGGGGG